MRLRAIPLPPQFAERTTTMNEDDDDDAVQIWLGKSDALNVAAFLEAYGDGENDRNIAENIRYQVREAAIRHSTTQEGS
jgi:hypothetical protein